MIPKLVIKEEEKKRKSHKSIYHSKSPNSKQEMKGFSPHTAS
jgi:hypothetical protein